MRVTKRGNRRAVARTAFAAVMAGVLAASAAACGGEDEGEGGPIKLTVDVFGEPGYDQLYKQYEASHPNIKIQQRKVASLDDYKPRLQQWIATGSGAGDVVAIEEGILPLYMLQRGKFVNLFDHGGRELRGNFQAWKWEQGLSPDGKQLVGLGTDVGALAMCYRKDLFKDAGLPTERDDVSKLWPDWDKFYETGQKFQKEMPDTKWLDGPTAILRAGLLQHAGSGPGYHFFDKSNNLVASSNPVVKQAFDNALRFSQSNMTANLSIFTPPWQNALKRDTFATVPCPSWMLGGIEEFSGDFGKGKWDVAAVPGGAGYWGGSHLAVPKQSDHPKEAAELAKFLTSPQGQVAAFKDKKVYPSSPQAAQDPAVAQAKSAYFSDAPIGEIFGQMVAQAKPVYLAPKNEDVRLSVENILIAVGQNKVKPDQAWQQALDEAQKAAR